MHYRRLSCLLLGAWLACSLFMTMVATQNFRSVDQLLERPAPAASLLIHEMGREAARQFLRYQVSEQNRWYFNTWELIQLPLGVLLLWALLLGNPESKWILVLGLAMLILAAAQHFGLTPSIVDLGRTIDFVPATPRTQERATFWVYHTIYSGVEVVKWGLGFTLAFRLVVRRSRRSPVSGSQRQARKVDVVNETDDGHVNG